jgi:hypothetical protein
MRKSAADKLEQILTVLGELGFIIDVNHNLPYKIYKRNGKNVKVVPVIRDYKLVALKAGNKIISLTGEGEIDFASLPPGCDRDAAYIVSKLATKTFTSGRDKAYIIEETCQTCLRSYKSYIMSKAGPICTRCILI